jgi:hypothetical protein
VKKFFYDPLGSGRAFVNCVVSLTGFALVGGPARQDAPKAVEALKQVGPIGGRPGRGWPRRGRPRRGSNSDSWGSGQALQLGAAVERDRRLLRPGQTLCSPSPHRLCPPPFPSPSPFLPHHANEQLNVPYLVSLPLVFQTTEEWLDSELGVHPVQVALQVALPELDGGIEPIVFAGRDSATGKSHSLPDRIDSLCRWVWVWAGGGDVGMWQRRVGAIAGVHAALENAGGWLLPPATWREAPSRPASLHSAPCLTLPRPHALRARLLPAAAAPSTGPSWLARRSATRSWPSPSSPFPPTRATWAPPPTSTSSAPSTAC